MIGKSTAIIGAGVSGLALAFLIASPSNRVAVFEANPQIGGRVCVQQAQHGGGSAYGDYGANIIDFQNQNEKQVFSQFILPLNSTLSPFTQPFLLYQDGLFRKGDYHKQRYYFQGGFLTFLRNLADSLKERNCTIHTETLVARVQMTYNHKWALKDGNQLQVGEYEFDEVVFACPAPRILQIVQSSQQPALLKLQQACSGIEYTRQISACFQLSPQLLKEHSFSCLLFLKHPALAFMSSHHQKYPANSPQTVVIQSSPKFSSQNYDKPATQISKMLHDSIPPQLQQSIGKCINIKKWDLSLVKNVDAQKKDLPFFWDQQRGVYAVGDGFYGKSRVSSCVYAAVKLEEKMRSKL